MCAVDEGRVPTYVAGESYCDGTYYRVVLGVYAFPYFLDMGASIFGFGYGGCVIPNLHGDYVLLRVGDDWGACEVGPSMFI